jgi:hypothetical protein
MSKKIKDKYLNSKFIVVGEFGQFIFSKRYLPREVNSFYTVNPFFRLAVPKDPNETIEEQKEEEFFDPKDCLVDEDDFPLD